MSRRDQLRVSGGIMAGIVASGGATATAIYQPMVLLGAAGVVFVLIVGVVLPAVWSRKKERRAAAVRVLRELLTAIRPVIPTPTPLATASRGPCRDRLLLRRVAVSSTLPTSQSDGMSVASSSRAQPSTVPRHTA